MPEPSRFALFTRKLNALGIRYMVTGSVASMAYGTQRLTNDVDIVVVLKREDAARLHEAFPFSDFYCPPIEVIRTEMARSQRGQFNLLHHDTGFKADLYLAGNDPLNAWGFQRAQRIEFLGEEIVVSPPELVILRKLEFFREGGSEKHVVDICAMLDVSREKMDFAFLEEMVRERGLQEAWARVQKAMS